MITFLRRIGSYSSDFYDLTQSDEEYVKKEIAQCREKASAYLSKKNRTKYYALSGESTIDDFELPEGQAVWFSEPYTDEEVQRIATLIIDCYNKGVDDANLPYEKLPYDTDIFDLCKDLPLHETEGFSEELDALIHKRAADNDMRPFAISLKPHYRYRFTALFYDKADGTLLHKKDFTYILTDEVYIDLLAQRLFVPKQFCYNRLVLTHPQLMQSITEYLHDWYYYDSPKDLGICDPFIIHFTEIEEDAKAVLSEQENER